MAGLQAVDDAGDDVALLAGVLLEDKFSLGLTQALQHHLLGGLRGDAAGVLGKHLDVYGVAHVSGGRDFFSLVQGDLDLVVLYLFDHSLAGEDAYAAGAAIDAYDEVRVGQRVHLVGRGQRRFYGFEDHFFGQVLLSRKQRDRGEEVALQGLWGWCANCGGQGRCS